MKLPAFQFYPGDWRKDIGVQSLGYFERGVWFELLCLMHESEQRGKLILNGIAMPEESLARLLGLDNQILKTTLTTLLISGVASRDEETGALMCRRMVRDEKIRQIRKKCGKQGGNPILVKQNPTTGVKQIRTPSSSSSSSSSDTPLPPKGERDLFPAPELIFPQQLRTARFMETWESWVQCRKAKKKCKDWIRMFQAQLKWLRDFPEPTAIAILEQSIRNDWQGLQPLARNNGQPQPQKFIPGNEPL